MTEPRKARPAPRPVDLNEIRALVELAAQQPPLTDKTKPA